MYTSHERKQQKWKTSTCNRLRLRNNWLKFKTAGKSPTILEEFYRIYPNLIKENRRMSTFNQLGVQTSGSQPVCPTKMSPITGWNGAGGGGRVTKKRVELLAQG